MAYQVLARKWRPQDFSGVVGQAPIVTALRNALTEGRIAQAYLFSGIRGVGKTSVARVLAKALNCERGPAADPCNDCTPCREITAGSDLDVIEVDAATYSKVEQVRELTESLKYGPARDHHKVVVLDEIHRLSRQAFDALLKIVEEPPARLVFIFATTEIDDVPATILSRCQEFHFRRVPSAELVEHLRFLAGEESIEVSDTALRLIARAGEGSVRDSVALLDQLTTFGSGSISDAEAGRLLGGVDSSRFHGLLQSILGGDTRGVVAAVAEVESEGWDPRHVFAQFLAYLRDGLHLALGTPLEQIDLPAEETQLLSKLSRGCGYESLLRLSQQLLASEATVRRSELGSLALEIALLRAAELPRLTRLETLLAGGAPEPENEPEPGPENEPDRLDDAARPVRRRRADGPAGRPPDSPRPTPAAVEPSPPAPIEQPETHAPESAPDEPPRAGPPPMEPDEPDEPDAEPAPTAAVAEVGAVPRVAESTATGSPAPASSAQRLHALLEEVSRKRGSLAAHLAEADRLVFDQGTLEISVPAGERWLVNALERQANRKILETALERVFGDGATWHLVEVEPAVAPPARDAAATLDAPTNADDDPSQHPTVQTLLELFDGSVESVESSGDEPEGPTRQ